ncbi:M16 family metallopeptidase [Brevibacterium moorei]|uniref:M16 family metallopeptidase n=1 Tax=Brevibacterium moorei TaxID=2968457 RepID=UPI00211BE594|nr:insulinase family protein [Brevibacterium sp. 68QC2CO]
MHTEALLGEGSGVFRTALPSGIRVITETMPGLSSETVGVWVDSGSRDETPETAGSTHFLEHMLFKGTHRHSSKDIARIFDLLGGDSNAVTAKDYTCYFARCILDDLPQATDLLWDMVLDALLDAGEFERERGVIIEELAMAADDPLDVLFETADQVFYSDQPLGRPVGATRERIRDLGHGELLEHYRHAYVGPRLVFAAAGGAGHEQIVDLVLRATAHLPAVAGTEVPAGGAVTGWAVGRANGTGARPARATSVFTPGVQLLGKDLEQQQLLLGFEGVSELGEDRFASTVLQSLLGGGMSSRLFQSVREEHGLAYSVYCTGARYPDVGDFGIYAGCAPEKAQQVLDLCQAEFERLAALGPSAAEVVDVAAQASAATVLGMESTAVRMNRLARSELTGQRLRSAEWIVDAVRSVTGAQVRDLAARMLAGPRALVAIGPRTDLHLP